MPAAEVRVRTTAEMDDASGCSDAVIDLMAGAHQNCAGLVAVLRRLRVDASKAGCVAEQPE